MKPNSEKDHKRKLSELEKIYDQILDQLIEDIIKKLHLMIEEEELFEKLFKIQQKMKSYSRKMKK